MPTDLISDQRRYATIEAYFKLVGEGISKLSDLHPLPEYHERRHLKINRLS